MRQVDTLTWFESNDGQTHLVPVIYVDSDEHPWIYLKDERGKVAYPIEVTDPEEVEIWEAVFSLINGAEIREAMIRWWNSPEHICCDPV